MRMLAGLCTAAALSVAALVLVATATAEDVTKSYLPRDQGLARSIVLGRRDMGSADVWKGGATKPYVSGNSGCPGFEPKQADLVVTGAAASSFLGPGMKVDTQVVLLESARMVRLDWERTVLAPQALPCIGHHLSSRKGGKLVSVERISFPAVAPRTHAVRAVIATTSNAGAGRLVFDFIAIGKGRTEITVATTALGSLRELVVPLEVHIAQVIARRAPAR